jgi:hypothetical protein
MNLVNILGSVAQVASTFLGGPVGAGLGMLFRFLRGQRRTATASTSAIFSHPSPKASVI